MKYSCIILTIFLLSCSTTVQKNEWKEKKVFLSDSVFLDDDFQKNEFAKYEGLWSCVREERNSDGEVVFPKYCDLLLSDRKAWRLDYPCSWTMQNYFEDVYLKNDSIFFSTKDRLYIERKKIQIKNDTLVIFGAENYDESKYYVRKAYDSLTLSNLKLKGFNEKCILGKWELKIIGDGASQTWVISDGFLDHVPRNINFSLKEFTMKDGYLLNTKNQQTRFKILQFDRSYSNYYGEETFLTVKELQEIDGVEYHYDYDKIK